MPAKTAPRQFRRGLAQLIRQARRARQMSMYCASVRMGVSRQTWRNYELGRIMPSAWNLVRIMSLLGLNGYDVEACDVELPRRF